MAKKEELVIGQRVQIVYFIRKLLSKKKWLKCVIQITIKRYKTETYENKKLHPQKNWIFELISFNHVENVMCMESICLRRLSEGGL